MAHVDTIRNEAVSVLSRAPPEKGPPFFLLCSRPADMHDLQSFRVTKPG